MARLDLQTMLNTYPDSEYRMRAKLAVGDSWFKEGGTAALTQAEAEYKDFITFFPDAPEAAEAQMKVGDIYYQQMEKPDRDYNNAQDAEQAYRAMINMFPDSALIPRAKQKLRDVQEVLAERETQIGLYYGAARTITASIARLQTVVDTYPLYSKSDQALLAIGDAYAGEARAVQIAPNLPGAVRERLARCYHDRAAAAYGKVITRYPMAPHVEDARDRLVAMNRPVPEPYAGRLLPRTTQRSAAASRFVSPTIRLDSSSAVQRWWKLSTWAILRWTIRSGRWRLILRKKTSACTKRRWAGQPSGTAVTPTGPNEPPRSDQPSELRCR